MGVRFGFPGVFSQCDEIVVVWICIEKKIGSDVGVEVFLNNVRFNERIRIDQIPYADILLSRLFALGYDVALRFEASIDLTSIIVQSNDKKFNKLDFDGPSSTLAQYLAAELGYIGLDDENQRRVLVSGRCNIDNGEVKIFPLGSEGKLKEKCRAVDGQSDVDLWIHCEDFNGLDSSLREKVNVRPFKADECKKEWLIEELCQVYGLISREVIYKNEESAAPNEKDLFSAAIDPVFFENRDIKLNKYFSRYPARALLPLQEQILDPENNGLFPNSINPSIRHAFVSGPTGCGKTTIVQSLVLNVMHNRLKSVVYVAPVKALVEEFHWTILGDGFRELLPPRSEGEVLFSTSDHIEFDAKISKGDFVLASMVYEKANIFLAGPDGSNFVDKLDLLVLDEIHMLQDGSRGDVVDMLVTKIMRTNETRARSGEQPIQLLMISTEGIAEELKCLPGFKNKIAKDADVSEEPINIKVDARDPPFDHFLYRRIDGKITTVKICEFDSQFKRQLPRDKIDTLLNLIDRELKTSVPTEKLLAGALRNAGLKKGGRSEPAEHFYTNILKFVDWLVRDEGHRSIIVVCNAISLCDSLAAGFSKNYMGHRLDRREVADSFKNALKDSEFEREKRTRYLSWAERGVYTHHSQMPARLRSAVADQLRLPFRANSRPHVLFTTETLAYGVNLSASAIVLTDLEFLRSDPVNPAVLPCHEELSSNQYHNILGRAGRKSFENKAIKSAAYIRIPEPWQAPNGSLVRQRCFRFLERHYCKKEADSSLPLSTIAHRADFLTMREPADLKEYSYSIFRTILECVRSADKGVKKSGALEIFRRTLGYMTAKTALKKNLDELFDKVFDEIVDYRSGALTLLLKTGDRFSVQPTAEALLNTGISVHAVEPIALWLELIRNSGFTANNSAVLLLPALIVAPEFTQSANELLYLEQLKRFFGTQQEVEKNTERCRQLAQLNLLDFGFNDEIFDLMESYLDTPPVVAALGIFPQDIMQKACYYLLISGVLIWLKGGSVSEMGKAFTHLFPQDFTNQRFWQPKYADRLELLVRMTSNFFSQGRGYLSDSMRLALPKFCFQVKFGLPNRALPYRNVFAPSETVLPRAAILALNSAIDDPFLLLGSKNFFDVAKVLEKANIDAQFSERSIQKVLRQTYARSLENFVRHLNDNRTESFFNSALASLREVGRHSVDFTEGWSPQRLLNVAIAHFDEERLACYSIEPVVGKLQLLGWHQLPSQKFVGITPCAFLLIHALSARNAISVGKFIENSLRAGRSRIDVEWIAAQMWDDLNGLDQLNRLREPLLSFIEPKLEIYE